MNLGKKGITLLALVITIIIMLLLAGVVIQMAVGENGLFVKATQSKQEQAKSELYETAKLEYLNLKTKAIEQGQQDPPVSAVLSATNFLAKYDLDGSNIKDKKGDIIDTRDNLLDKLEGMSSSDVPIEPSPQPYPEQSYPKTIDGVTIQEQDKDKMILKIKIKEQTKIGIRKGIFSQDNLKVDWGDGQYGTFKPSSYDSAEDHEYRPGNFIMKIKGAKSIKLINDENKYDKFEVTVLQWGKFEEDNIHYEENSIELNSVKDIKMPEPNDVTVNYRNSLISSIPEDLFKYKPTRQSMSYFQNCPNITSIPEDLYKYNTGMTAAYNFFSDCNITNIPEGLFKYNKNLKTVHLLFVNNKIRTIPENLFKYNTKLKMIADIFSGNNIKNLPENLFKYNTEVETFINVFSGLESLESIPEKIFSNNKKVKSFENAFAYNYKLKTIPENLFKYNTEVEKFGRTFFYCREIETIPENLFKYNNKANDFGSTFTYLKKIETIPENLFKYNTEALNFNHTFSYCEKLKSIPDNLFQNNNKAESFGGTFSYCKSLTHLRLPWRCYSLPESQYRGIFAECRNANNYYHIPESAR